MTLGTRKEVMLPARRASRTDLYIAWWALELEGGWRGVLPHEGVKVWDNALTFFLKAKACIFPCGPPSKNGFWGGGVNEPPLTRGEF